MSDSNHFESIADTVKPHQPTFDYTYKLIEKIWSTGFLFRGIEGYQKKVAEELYEFNEAYDNGDDAWIEEELGDLMLAVFQLIMRAEKSPEKILLKALNKFKNRFKNFEAAMKPLKDYHHFSEEDLLSLWQKAKQMK